MRTLEPEASTSEGTMANDETQALNDQPKAKSSSLDNLLLLLVALFFAGICAVAFLNPDLLILAVPVLILIMGAVLAFRSGDIKNVKVTGRFVQIIVILAMLFFGICILRKLQGADIAAKELQAAELKDLNERFHAIDLRYRMEEERDECISLAVAMGSVALIIEFLWIRPLARQLPIWRVARFHKKVEINNNRIIGRDSLTPYSIANELLKWSKLRDDGLITEDEYQNARMTLLNRG
jgi:D-alanyl-lipoteichoic acid acyltransferase DltB (MBOAT superfamily)